jgi:hypothetical protein
LQNVNEQRSRLEQQRQSVVRQIAEDQQNVQNSQGVARQAAQQSLDADRRQLQAIDAQLQQLQTFQEAENQNQQNFG